MARFLSVGGALCMFVGLTSPALALDQEFIDQAIERGVAHLKKTQKFDGTWEHSQIGATALAGLTLLECGVPPTDPAVRKAVEAVRKGCSGLTHTYSLALAVLMFDRLGEEANVPLIETCAVRLLAGQTSKGGWNYDCPAVPKDQAQRLVSLLRQQNKLIAGRVPKEAKPADLRVAERDLAQEIVQQIEVINLGLGKKAEADGRDDNSNTQFAILALWVARRYGLPADSSLARINLRFRATQNGDGGWSYSYTEHEPGKPRKGRSTPTMTCAGLLGLAMVHGAINEARLREPKPKKDAPERADIPTAARDPAVRLGLTALGLTIGHPLGKRQGMLALLRQKDGGRLYYFLWSLERVAVAYGLTTIGGKDWYGWGAEILVANQEGNGSWQGQFGGCEADTCFALLFLRRANLARDLTTMLRGKIEDPGESTLTAGGVGGADVLQRERMKSALEMGDAEINDPSMKRTGGPTPARPAAGNLDPETARLSTQLVEAAPRQQGEIIKKLRDARGVAYTDALAAAIPRLDGDAKDRAREALADRLTRMTAATLETKLKDVNAEVRRAAVLACAMKDEKEHIPRLIELLTDGEFTVERAAHAALKHLSGQDLGPTREADQAEKARAVAAWKLWWSRQPR